MNLPPTVSGWTPLDGSSASTVTGPSSTVPPVSSASANAPTNGSQRRKNRRRPQEAYDILSDFYHNVSDRPTKAERSALADRVKRIRGCEDYKPTDVNAYFASKRNNERGTGGARALERARHQPDDATSSGPLTSASILYPSLRELDSQRLLDVLLEDDPNPTREVAEIWAGRIGPLAKADDILIYAKLRRLRVHPPEHTSPLPRQPAIPGLPQLPLRSARRTQASQLPTPSISPEPASVPTSPITDTLGTSGRIVATVSVKEEQDELESDDDTEEMGMEESRGTEADTVALDSRLQNDLVMNLHKALLPSRLSFENDASAPRSFAQFGQWIGGKDQTSTALLEGISKGKYAHLGLKLGAPSTPLP